ncbi:MAG: hypothetical protein KC731_34920 [Myxococcales bacterium]|nr:hypothetical protein [Myxococcales bacterium]
MTYRPIRLALTFYLALAATACADGPAEPGEPTATNPSGVEGCDGVVWRQASPGRVLCFGADGCGCDLPQGCCVVDDLYDGACIDPSACGGGVLACDGPEDCGEGTVCCLRNHDGSSACVPADECALGDYRLCRSDADCDPDDVTRDECKPAEIAVMASCD